MNSFLHTITPEITQALQQDPDLHAAWDTLTPLARNEWICYITMPKQATTREQHLDRLKGDILSGKKRPCCWPGCPHRNPNSKKWFKGE